MLIPEGCVRIAHRFIGGIEIPPPGLVIGSCSSSDKIAGLFSAVLVGLGQAQSFQILAAVGFLPSGKNL